MTLYKKKYRVETARLAAHHYAYGTYLVTICTQKRMQWFGELHDGRMTLNTIGTIASSVWQEIPTHFPRVTLSAFIVMPNHIHGIIELKRVETRDSRVSTANEKKLAPPLGVIVNQFKGVVTKKVRSVGYEDFRWQPRFHDRIIRSNVELTAIKRYIAKNPTNWDRETIPWHADAQAYGL